MGKAEPAILTGRMFQKANKQAGLIALDDLIPKT